VRRAYASHEVFTIARHGKVLLDLPSSALVELLAAYRTDLLLRLAGGAMFGVDDNAVKRIIQQAEEATTEANKIMSRIDWITLCAKTVLVELAARFKIELPPPPPET
jgi:hypothetical protein